MTSRTRPIAGLFLSILLAGPAVAVAEEPVPATSQAAAAEAATSETPPDGARKRKVSVALLTVGLLTATGVALLAFTMLGGAATRRTLKRPVEPAERKSPAVASLEGEAAALEGGSPAADSDPPAVDTETGPGSSAETREDSR